MYNPRKYIRDIINKQLLGERLPQGVLDMKEYSTVFSPIKFEYHEEGGMIIAVSKNFRHGSIVTSGRDYEELDENIKDAIFTAFEVPAVYKGKVSVNKVGKERKVYATA